MREPRGREGARAALLRPHHAGRAHLRPRLLRPRRQARLRHRAFPAGGALPARRASARRRAATVLSLPTARCIIWTQSDRRRGRRRSATSMIVHDMSFVQRRSADTQEVRADPVRRHRAGGGADHHADRRDQLARLGGGRRRRCSRGRDAAALAARAEAARPPGCGPSCGRSRATCEALVRDLEAERHARDESQTVWGPEALRRILRQDLKGDEMHDRLQPRALHPRAAQGQRDRDPAPGERPRHGARAGDARLLGHLDRARQRHRPTATTVDAHDRVRVPPERADATRCAACG